MSAPLRYNDGNHLEEKVCPVEMFVPTLTQMLMMFVLIFVGFVLRRTRRLPENANVVMSRMELYAFTPALFLHSQMTKCTMENFSQHWPLMLQGLGVTLAGIALALPLSRLFVKKEGYTRFVYRYAMSFGNFGFMGNFIVLGVFGSDMFFLYGLFTLGMNILCNSYGLYILIPKEQGTSFAANLKKGILTPPVIATLCGMALGMTGAAQYLPEFFVKALDSAGNCQGPVAMLLAGFVVGGYSLKEMLLNKKVYIASAVRLILLPLAAVMLLRLLGAGHTAQVLTLIAVGTPLGLNTVVYPSAFGGDPKPGASMALISHTLSVISIPLMYLLLFG